MIYIFVVLLDVKKVFIFLVSPVPNSTAAGATQKYDIYTTYVCLTETYKNQTCNKQPYLRCTTVGPSLCKNMIE